jgi:hypothetical protein
MKPIQLIFLLLVATMSSYKVPDKIEWLSLEPGLSYLSLKMPQKSDIDNSKLDVLKIDPKYFKFRLVCAGENKSEARTAKAWGNEEHMIAVVNAGMFTNKSGIKHCTGYMKNGRYVDNPHLNPAYKDIVAFNPLQSGIPPFQILDLECQQWDSFRSKYACFAQGFRLLDCQQNNTWPAKNRRWSMVVIGEDTENQVLFLFVRSPYSMHDFTNQLLTLPLHLKRLMYLEGGPEASLYVNHPKLHLEQCGSYETGFCENDYNWLMWPIPNVIGIEKR